MPVKVPKATKDLAYQKLRDGLSVQEVSELTGMSRRSVGRIKLILDGKVALPSAYARKDKSQPASAPTDAETGGPEKTTIEFEDSPAPVDKKGVVDSALGSLKGMLGIPDKPTEKKSAPIAAKLDAKKQQFVDSVTPTASLGLIAIASWMWGRIGDEYAVLAPDEKVAQRIVEPLLRVYARHSNFLTDVNPDVADIGASVFALVGYVNVSMNMYRQIKQEKESDEYEDGRNGLRAATEGRVSGQGGGYAPIPGSNGSNGSNNGINGGSSPGFPGTSLSSKEAAQFTALSRLSQIDYNHRARKSGRAG